MADRRIQQLPLASTLGSSDIFHISQGGIDKRIASDTLISQLNGGTPFNFDIKTTTQTSYTLTLPDRSSYLRCTNSADIIVTVSPSSESPWLLGDQVIVRREGGRVDLTGGTGVTLNGGVTGLSLLAEGQSAMLTFIGSNTWDIDTGGVTQASTSSVVPADASSTIDAGVDTKLTLLSRDSGASTISLHGDSEGTGRVYVGQDTLTGGGIEYNGDAVPGYSGAGADYTTLYRVDSGTPSWTAKNSVSDDDWIFKGDIYANETDLVYTSANLDLSTLDVVPSDSSSTIDAGENTSLTLRSDDTGASTINLIGSSQGVGRVYVGQSALNGGGIEYDGAGSQDYTGAGADYVTLFRKNNTLVQWTAKNKFSDDDWIFKGDIYANETDLVYTSANLSISDLGYTGDLDANNYVHPSFTSLDVTTSGDEVISNIETNSEGHVTNVTKRSMDLSDLGYTGDLNANDYVHPTLAAKSIETTGAEIVSSLIYNEEGHVTESSQRVLTLADLGYTGDLDANNYVHPSFTSLDVTTSGDEVISNIETNSEGHVTNVTKRSMDLSRFVEISADQSIGGNKTFTGDLTIDATTSDDPHLIVDSGDLNRSSIIFKGNAGGQDVLINYTAVEGDLVEPGFALKIEGIGEGQQAGQKAHLEVEGAIYSENSKVYTSANLSISDLGYTGDLDANNYVHPSFTSLDVTTSGMEVISEVTSNSEGHVTNVVKRTLNAVPSNASSTIDAGENTSLTLLSDDSGESVLNLYGSNQGTGRVFVGQNSNIGGGIVYNGDDNPSYSGAGQDHVTFFTKSTDYGVRWTAKNQVLSLDWIFRGDIYANETDKVLTEADEVYTKQNITYGTGAAPAGMSVGDIFIELES